MKRLQLTLTLFAMLTNCGTAQTYFSFPDTNTTWSYLRCIHLPAGFPGWCFTSVFSITGDTIINNLKYRSIELDTIGHFAAIREDSLKKVYMINTQDSVEYLKFNFAGNIGDTMRTWPHASYSAIIDYKDSIYIAGTYRQRYICSNNETVIEGIGSLDNLLGFANEPADYRLLCMTQNDTLIYQDLQYHTCDTTIPGIYNIYESVSIEIYPNPLRDFTIVKIEGLKHKWKWTLYNSLGQVVQLVTNITDSQLAIKRGALATGIYIYQVSMENKLVASGKLSVQ